MTTFMRRASSSSWWYIISISLKLTHNSAAMYSQLTFDMQCVLLISMCTCQSCNRKIALCSTKQGWILHQVNLWVNWDKHIISVCTHLVIIFFLWPWFGNTAEVLWTYFSRFVAYFEVAHWSIKKITDACACSRGCIADLAKFSQR